MTEGGQREGEGQRETETETERILIILHYSLSCTGPTDILYCVGRLPRTVGTLSEVLWNTLMTKCESLCSTDCNSITLDNFAHNIISNFFIYFYNHTSTCSRDARQGFYRSSSLLVRVSIGQALYWSSSLLVKLSIGQGLHWSRSLSVRVSICQALYRSRSPLVKVSVGQALYRSRALYRSSSLSVKLSIGQGPYWSRSV